jgi:hypothetical protein
MWTELPYELGRLHLLLHTLSIETQDPASRRTPRPDRRQNTESVIPPNARRHWFVAGRRVEERDRLITSSSPGCSAPAAAAGRASCASPRSRKPSSSHGRSGQPSPPRSPFPRPFPLRATPAHDGHAAPSPPPIRRGNSARRKSSTASPPPSPPTHFSAPFLSSSRSLPPGNPSIRYSRKNAPLERRPDTTLRVDAICGGAPTLMCGEWDGRAIRLLAILDGDVWFPLTPQQA